jgi:hypothetical protein
LMRVFWVLLTLTFLLVLAYVGALVWSAVR